MKCNFGGNGGRKDSLPTALPYLLLLTSIFSLAVGFSVVGVVTAVFVVIFGRGKQLFAF